jgi:Na+/H+ antiporter NhaA
MWGVVVGLVAGKFLGIGAGGLGGAALRLGRLPQGVGPGQVLGGAALSGISPSRSLSSGYPSTARNSGTRRRLAS